MSTIYVCLRNKAEEPIVIAQFINLQKQLNFDFIQILFEHARAVRENKLPSIYVLFKLTVNKCIY